jgi:hypothetical protein
MAQFAKFPSFLPTRHRFEECLLREGRERYGATVLWFMYDNFYRVWQALSVDPAMDAGFFAHAWSKAELVNVLLPKSLAT